jgi:hypothetical protein
MGHRFHHYRVLHFNSLRPVIPNHLRGVVLILLLPIRIVRAPGLAWKHAPKVVAIRRDELAWCLTILVHKPGHDGRREVGWQVLFNKDEELFHAFRQSARQGRRGVRGEAVDTDAVGLAPDAECAPQPEQRALGRCLRRVVRHAVKTC